MRRASRACGARVAATTALAAGLALPAAGCGGPSGDRVAQIGSTVAGTSTSTSPAPDANGALAFSRCMRAHGVGAYPDPSTAGLLPKRTAQQLGIGSATLEAARRACIHVVANSGRPSPPEVAAYRSAMLRYARCIRSHGVPNMPDPDSRGHLDIGPGTRVDVAGPAFQAAYRVCKKDLSP